MLYGVVDVEYNPAVKSWLSITRDTSERQVYLKLNSLTPEDTAVHYCVRNTVRKSQCEPRHKPPWGDGKVWFQGQVRTTGGALLSPTTENSPRGRCGPGWEEGGFLLGAGISSQSSHRHPGTQPSSL